MSGFDWTRCPVCQQPLSPADRELRCAAGHSFDVARQGYVNLLGRTPPPNADTAAMLDARSQFLGAGHYAPIARAVAEQVVGARVVEAGAGTGYYLAHLLDAHPGVEGLATDVSVAAAKRAAKAHPSAVAIVADTWAGLPILDAAVDTVVCVFAPRNPEDFARILRPGGRLIVAQPLPGHLAALREAYGLLDVADDKSTRLAAALHGWSPHSTRRVAYDVDLDPKAVTDLIAMGPNAFHGLPHDVQGARIGIEVEVSAWLPPTRG